MSEVTLYSPDALFVLLLMHPSTYLNCAYLLLSIFCFCLPRCSSLPYLSQQYRIMYLISLGYCLGCCVIFRLKNLIFV